MKKIITLFFIVLFFSGAFALNAGNFNVLFSSNTVIHSDEDYKELYGTGSFGWDTGISYEPFLGAELGIKYGQSYDNGLLSYTKENLTLNKNLISGFLNIYPLSLFMENFFFYVEPFIGFEGDLIMYSEESILGKNSGSKMIFSFGGGVSFNLNRKTKLLFSIKYRNFKTDSPSLGRSINTEGVVFGASLRLAVFNL